jgi:hypothetical protein
VWGECADGLLPLGGKNQVASRGQVLTQLLQPLAVPIIEGCLLLGRSLATAAMVVAECQIGGDMKERQEFAAHAPSARG